MSHHDTFYDVIRQRGVSRRDFLSFCALTATMLGLGPKGMATVAHAMETKPRIPVLWLHGLECTCCSESFLRSGLRWRAGAPCAPPGWGPAARPNPTKATPVHKLVSHVPVINVPGCPPIAEVMTGV